MDSLSWNDAQALAYIASYADLRRAFGTNAAAGRTHYSQAGAAEGRTITFDALGYLATYVDLRAAFGADVVAATQHFIGSGAAEGRTVSFDAMAYLATYSDLRAVFGTNIAAATRHFVDTGAAEGRVVSFDAMAYLATYADLRAVFGADTAAATRHFVGTGAAEGRTISFDALAYLASYADLRAAFGGNTAAATRHFVQTGAAEGRSISFDGLSYIASYSDLRAAFGTNASAGLRHFMQTGAGEGRSVSFDPVTHLLSQPDLIAAGLGVQGALRHWILYGANEGRSANGAFGTEQAGHGLQLSRPMAGAIDQSGDRDWFRIDLAAGTGVTFDLASPNASATLSIRDAEGRVLSAGETSGSLASFQASKSGAYYLVLSGVGSASGAYTLTARDYYTVTGTFGNDTLTGTNGADLIRGLDGFDTLNGRSGHDILEGGLGSDTLNGGLGNDVLYGNNAANSGAESGSDQLADGEGGDDQLFGQHGNDHLSVSRFSFTNPAPSTVLLDGGDGDDNLTFSSSRHLDTATLLGGSGNDAIYVGPVLKSTIDAGGGDDKVTISTTGGDQTITLGAGADVLTLEGFSSAFAIGNPTRITDFQVGADVLSFDQYLGNTLIGWNKSSNPFGAGYLRLVQSGADSLLQLDRDGTATGDAFGTLLTFANTTISGFTARELGYAPDGSAGAGQTIIGTSGTDTLTGTEGSDIIRGLDGSDTLTGRGGNDVLEGGSGYDRLDGGVGDDIVYGNNAANSGPDTAGDNLFDSLGGNDQLFGQDGRDQISVSRYSHDNVAASTVLLDGGNGDDDLAFNSHSRHLDTVELRGGAGNDRLRTGSVLRSTIDAGEGNDVVTITTSGGSQTVTLGAGADMLTLDGNSFPVSIGDAAVVTDFQIGADTVNLDRYLVDTLLGRDRTVNPFSTGHLRLVQSGADTLLQIDRDGSASSSYGLVGLLSFSNTAATSFTARELGDAPDGSPPVAQTVTGTIGADNIRGSNADDRLFGSSGDDTLDGRGGNDVLEGGSGSDQLDGGIGNDVLYGNVAGNGGSDTWNDNLSDTQGGDDQLFGQDGNDHLMVTRYSYGMSDGGLAASTILLDGGLGDDDLNFYSNNRNLDTVTLRGGLGNDDIFVGSVLQSTIDAGEGNDKVTIELSGGSQTITLGAGADSLGLSINALLFQVGAPTLVTDFQIGSDTLVLEPYLALHLLGWDKMANPFGTGHLKLVQSGTDARLELDRDGSSGRDYELATLLTFANTSASSFTSKELGYTPIGQAGMLVAEQMAIATGFTDHGAMRNLDHFLV